MIASAWLTAALGAAGLLLSADGAVAMRAAFRPRVRPTYANAEACPERCGVSGPNTGNWSAYPSFDRVRTCQQTMFYDFSLYDLVDDPSTHHRIYACSSLRPDFSRLPSSAARTKAASAAPVDVNFEVGWWEDGFGLADPGLRSLIKQIRKYVDKGHDVTDRPFILYGQSCQATLGLYVGQGLLNQGVSKSTLRMLHNNIAYLNVSTPSLAMQLYGLGYDSTCLFGVIVTSNGTFTPIQDAIKTWPNGTCRSLAGSKGFPGQAIFTTPRLQRNGTTNSTIRARDLRLRAECRIV